jgi:hypothetical protein
MSKENNMRKVMIKIAMFWGLIGVVLFEIAIIVDYSLMSAERLEEQEEKSIVVPFETYK